MSDGGHAFPNITPDMPVDGGPGMTLRDYFAAHADVPWNAVIETLNENGGSGTYTVREVLKKRATMKYLEADAMLDEREGR